MLFTSISFVAALALAPLQAPADPAPATTAAPTVAPATAPIPEATPAAPVEPPVAPAAMPTAPVVEGAMGMGDTTPPVIDDFALAHQAPDAPPRVTAVVHDDASGIETVTVYFRTAAAGPFTPVQLSAGSGGLFLGSLENGIQRSGFFYYVEVIDAAGNKAELGNDQTPIYIDAAGPSVGRIFKKPTPQRVGPPIGTHWVAIAYGMGIVGLAVSIGFLFDVGRNAILINAGSKNFLDDLNIVPSVRPDDQYRQQLQTALILDATILAVSGVVTVAGLTTGTVLLAINAMEE